MQTRWRSSFYGVSDEQQKERFLGKGGTLARGEAIKIGKAYESTKIKVQKYQCSTNRPPAKESIKAVSKNKPKKVLKCNYCASKMGAHGFSGKKLGPTWGTVYRK